MNNMFPTKEAIEYKEVVAKVVEESQQLLISKELKDHYDKLLAFRDGLTETNGTKKVLTKNSDVLAAMNSVTRVLTTLSKQLKEVHSAENFAKTKQVLITVLKDTDEDVAERYLDALKQRQLV